MRVSPFRGSHLLMVRWRTSNVGAEFRNPGLRSVGLRIRVIVVRPPELQDCRRVAGIPLRPRGARVGAKCCLGAGTQCPLANLQ